MIALYAGYGVLGAIVYVVLRWLVCLEMQRNDRRREHEEFLAANPGWQSQVKVQKSQESVFEVGAGLECDDPNDPGAHHKRMIRERIEQMRRDGQL